VLDSGSMDEMLSCGHACNTSAVTPGTRLASALRRI
jgi:hypothetical protein